MAAMLAFQENDSAAANGERMTKAYERVTTGQVTMAVRNTNMNGMSIQEGHYIGILDKAIVATAPTALETARDLLAKMLSGGEIVTVLTGEGASGTDTRELSQWLSASYPDAEIEVHDGGQPLYPYLFAVEA
jgi:dihydroxyacetone kinase-like predicted kinase